MQTGILCPVFALVALTALVWVRMIVQRFGAVGELKLAPEAVGSRQSLSQALGTRDTAGNAYLNLHEMPTLFYVLVALLVVLGKVTPGLVWAAWAYVALRALQALIHLTYNNPMHRFLPFALSSLVLWGMWIAFALSLRMPAAG